ncbi:methyltransferase domain-containing protein, partial [bacterium]|nr:methyltransferase domain-containing protein [bacterium]
MARPTQWLSRLLPAPLHSKLEQAAFARDRAKRARKLSTGSKRLDLCAAQVAMLLHLAGQSGKYPFRGKRCLEVGSGWVPSYAVICHLLGAESFVATDIAPFILPGELRYALHESRLSNIRDVLAPFEDHCLIRERLDALLAVEDFTFDTLKSIGFEYIAPIDVARTRPDVEADVALSFSVLEHVPAEDIVPLLQNLADCLTPGGQMIHCVHLEDHKSTRKTPFKFLTLS